MALQKQTVSISFSEGLDTKTDEFQVQLGKFLSLKNSVFTKGKRLQKRNGFGSLTRLPDNSSTYLTTFNNDLTAIGSELLAYSAPTQSWINQSDITPIGLDALSLIRNNTNQLQADSATAPNGFVCTVYTDQDPSNLTTNVHKFAVADSVTGQNIVEPTLIADADPIYGAPKVFLLSSYFIVSYVALITASYHLRYIAIPVSNPTEALGSQDVSVNPIAPSNHGQAFDAVVYNNSVYFAFNGASPSGLNMTRINNGLIVSPTILQDALHLADIVSMSADALSGTIWVLYYAYVANTAYALAVNTQLDKLPAYSSSLLIIPAGSAHVVNITGSAQNGVIKFFSEIENFYSYDSSIPTHYINVNWATEGRVLGTEAILLRSLGLASKSFIMGGVIYVGALYVSPYQSTYFLVDETSQIVSKFNYQNAPTSYYSKGVPGVSVQGSVAQFCYLIKDLIQSVNKNTHIPDGSQVKGIYSQTGINLIGFTFGSTRLTTAELGQNLNLSGGFTEAYDGYSLCEQGFFLYPDSIEATWSDTGGSMEAQPDGSTHISAYFYQITYEWCDNQGNIFRSAPSIPVSVDTGTGSTGSVSVNIPTLRLSLKNVNNPVKLVVYRWSVGQQSYYQTTSILLPTLNQFTIDDITFVDTNADDTILGNNLLYTTGGVLENIGPPAFDSVFIFDSRLWGIVSEDKNLLWFSKPVIEATPVEMSDLLTLFVSPTIGAQGSTGDLKCGAQMDDKLILFKKSAMNYVAGVGPDITGANNGYTQPIFITSTVGCSNQNSIVFQPQGLMFEFASKSGNQIWVLSRNLETQYIGAAVEGFTQQATILSAVNIPGTNQVRFTLSSGVTLMYDYYYSQWGTFNNIPAISSVLYQGLHTYINSLGQVFRETPGAYLDGSSPVLMNIITSWINLAGLQGYQRSYFFYLLGVYLSPHLLNVGVAYDYNPAIQNQYLISPDNFSPKYGEGFNYGDQPVYGGVSSLEQWKIYLTQQRCESFQITLTELFNPAMGEQAGAGFTLSGLDLVLGLKKGFRPMKYTSQIGGGSA